MSAEVPTVLVTGGAGYIGSHACKALRRAGYLPVTVDDLTTGWADAVRFGPLEKASLEDRAHLDDIFARWQPVAVMHFAALSDVGQSAREPGLYWRRNVCGAASLLDAMVAGGCPHLVFSSTCAVYGEQDGILLDEESKRQPINAYGASKAAIEDMIDNFSAAHGLEAVIFRYFNVAGADPEAEIGEFHRPETHLVPLVLDTISGRREALTIFGTDYDTPDGTCIRDYVHVVDLVDAHLSGLEWLRAGKGNTVFNLGSGKGYSVREVIETAERVTGERVNVVEGARRPGDCTRLVSGSRKAEALLGWKPTRPLENMILDAWRWHQRGDYRA